MERIHIASIGVAILVFVAGAMGSDHDKTKDLHAASMSDIITAWEQRASTCKRAAFWYNETLTRAESPDGDESNIQYITLPRSFEVHLGEASKILTRSTGKFGVTRNEHGYFNFVISNAFDGRIGTELYGDGYPMDAKQGFVGSSYSFKDDPEMLPIVLTHRPFGGTLRQYDIRHWEFEGPSIARDGTECIAIAYAPAASSTSRFRMLLDPRRNYVPLEITHKHEDGDRVFEDYVIVYDVAANLPRRWYPIEWRYTTFWQGGDQISTALEAKVERVQFDREAPNVSYQVKFGAGTVVQHEHLGEIEVIRNDGSRVRYLHSDWEAGLLDDDAFSVHVPSWRIWTRRVLYLLGAAAAFGLAFLGRRLFARR